MKKAFLCASFILTAFIVWTGIILTVDIQNIGPLDSPVGLAAINGGFHKLTGVHPWLYHITDWLSIIPLGIVCCFAILGLKQWITRKNLRYVDFDILVLGGFYVVVILLFIFFEIFVVNYRPVLIENVLEASYPSSTTMLVMCVIPTAILQFQKRINGPAARRGMHIAMGIYMILMVIGRLISGVHWLTDIIGGILLSTGLVTLYIAVCGSKRQ